MFSGCLRFFTRKILLFLSSRFDKCCSEYYSSVFCLIYLNVTMPFIFQKCLRWSQKIKKPLDHSALRLISLSQIHWFSINDSTSHKTVLLLDIIIYIGGNAKIWCSHTFRLNEVPFSWATVRVCHSDIQHYVNLTDILSSNQNHQVQFVWFHLSLYSLQIIYLISKWNLLISPRLFHQIFIGLSNTYCLPPVSRGYEEDSW